MKPSVDTQRWRDYFGYDVNQAASEFCDQPHEEAALIADVLGVDYFSDVVSRLETDAAACLLKNLPETCTQEILTHLAGDKAGLLREILSYAPGTAGALMAKEVLSIPADSDIGSTISYLQSLAQDKKGKVSYIYVVDGNTRLQGVIQVRDLIFYSSDKPVKDILKSPVVQVETGMSQLDVARLLQRHRYLGLPVVDKEQRLVGIISADTAMKVFESEAVDDLSKVVGTSAEEFKTLSVRKIIALRLPWLFVNIASGLACAYISGLFQQDFYSVATLFLFVPIVLGLSESMGVQGATIVVRNIAMGRVSFKHLGELFVREALAGVFIGCVCGMLVGSIASFWKADRLIGVAMTISMATAIIISALLGLALPMLFKRVKIDPAIASGPLVLAICDIQTLAIYFSLSSAILKCP
jgi:magnesium transporter